jgi:hypothetical protein
MRVRIYEVTPLSPGRWKVVNTLNSHEYVTYGTEAEVTVQLKNQADLLEKKDPRLGYAWRNTMTKTS